MIFITLPCLACESVCLLWHTFWPKHRARPSRTQSGLSRRWQTLLRWPRKEALGHQLRQTSCPTIPLIRTPSPPEPPPPFGQPNDPLLAGANALALSAST